MDNDAMASSVKKLKKTKSLDKPGYTTQSSAGSETDTAKHSGTTLGSPSSAMPARPACSRPQPETDDCNHRYEQDEIVRPTKTRKSSENSQTPPVGVVTSSELFRDDLPLEVQCKTIDKKPKLKPVNNAEPTPTNSVSLPGTTPKPNAKALYPYLIEDNMLKKWEKTKDGETLKVVGNRVEVEAVLIDENTKEVMLDLSYHYKGMSQSLRVSRSVLTRSRIIELLAYGVDVTDSKVADVVAFLNKQEQIAPCVRAHTSLGVGEVDGKPVFRLARGIGFESVYIGDLEIRQKGTYSAWHQLMEDEVLGHPPLELALVFGLASLVVALLREVTGQDTLLVHLYGDSTQGKTTAAMVAVASFGEPHTTSGGLMLSWNATDNAIVSALRNNHGVPLAIDEASLQNGKDFTSMIYVLSMGREKARAKVDGSLQKSAEWSGLLVSTAEHSLSSNANQNTGLQMRILEFGNESWTKCAENSNRLKEGLRQNYGYAGEVFAEHLLAIGRGQVEALWREWRERLIEELPEEDRFRVRLADKLALLLATAEMAAEALSLDLDLPAIKGVLLRADQLNPAERDLADKAYDFLVEHFTSNKSSFSTSPGPGNWDKQQCLGRYVSVEGLISEVHFLPSYLRRGLREAGFPDHQVVLRALREKGLLDAEAGKLTRKKKVLGQMQNVYVLRLKQDLLEDSFEH